jgi:hypothetical protein
VLGLGVGCAKDCNRGGIMALKNTKCNKNCITRKDIFGAESLAVAISGKQ